MINDMFDILNAKNKFCKDKGKQGVTKESLSELKKKIDDFVSYIEKLEIDVKVKLTRKKNNTTNADRENVNGAFKIVRKPVLQATCVLTGFTGLIISLTNLYTMCDDLFRENIVSYFLSYNLSQDHVEMFFALIRRMNGFTTKPTTIQFKSAYKKLMLNNMNIIAPTSSNCTAQDKTLLIYDQRDLNNIQQIPKSDYKNVKAVTKKKKINRKISIHSKTSLPVYHFLHKNSAVLEHDYSQSENWIHSEYLEDIVKHTAGAIVHFMKRKIHCQKCLNMLNGQSSGMSKLTTCKDRGGKYPSDDVHFICCQTKKVIRKNKNKLLSKDINFLLVTEMLKILPRTILSDNEHLFEQEPLHDHRHQLIFLIIQSYVDLRLKHESNKLYDSKYRVRMFYNKLTIFKGE